MKLIPLILVSLSVAGLLSGCAGSVKGNTPTGKKAAIQKMCRETLADLYKLYPPARKDIQNAYGYAVFSNVGINLFLVSTGQGYGVAHDNRTGKDI